MALLRRRLQEAEPEILKPPQDKFIVRVAEFPIVAAAVLQVTTLVNALKAQSAILALPFLWLDFQWKLLLFIIQPLLIVFAVPLALLNEFANKQLDKLERAFPIILKPAPFVLASLRQNANLANINIVIFNLLAQLQAFFLAATVGLTAAVSPSFAQTLQSSFQNISKSLPALPSDPSQLIDSIKKALPASPADFSKTLQDALSKVPTPQDVAQSISKVIPAAVPSDLTKSLTNAISAIPSPQDVIGSISKTAQSITSNLPSVPALPQLPSIPGLPAPPTLPNIFGQPATTPAAPAGGQPATGTAQTTTVTQPAQAPQLPEIKLPKLEIPQVQLPKFF